MPIKPISIVESKTHKLSTLKEAINLGYNIPETYLLVPPFEDDLYIPSSIDCDWLIRPSAKESRIGMEGGCCKKDEIISVVREVYKRLGEDIQLILQEVIKSDRAGVMNSSSSEVYIESVCGCGYGLARGGINPSSYYIKGNNVNENVVKQGKKYRIINAKMVEEPCGEFSSLSKEMLKELYQMGNDFPNKIIEWCSKDEKLYFLEYWHFTGSLDKMVRGRVTHIGSNNYDILVLPNSRIDFLFDVIKSRGIIARVGGYLSHLAINCLERRIPFIISDEDYQDGELVFLDENKRKVIRLDNFI